MSLAVFSSVVMTRIPLLLSVSHLYWFPPQNEEVLRSHHHEAHELVAKDLLNLISLQ